MNEAVIATATTDGKSSVMLAVAYRIATKIAGTTKIVATITSAHKMSFSTTREAIRSTSLSFSCWPTMTL